MKSLDAIAQAYGTDKSSLHHGYAQVYDRLFAPMRLDRIHLLEIGIGGDQDPDKGGESLRMWREYFPHAHIIGLDIYPKNVKLPNTTIHCGSQSDKEILLKLDHKRYSIIIDDGSHQYVDQVTTLVNLFPNLRSGGYYCIEDIHTSYWKEFGGALFQPGTFVEIMKDFVDHLNYKHVQRIDRDFKPHHLAKYIYSISFYDNLIVLQRK